MVVFSREKVKLKFPHHFYFLEENKLRSYSLAAKESIDLQSFRPASANQVASAQFVIYSAVKRTWLVFFRKSGSNEKEKWVYTLVREGEVGAIQPWFAPGEKSNCGFCQVHTIFSLQSQVLVFQSSFSLFTELCYTAYSNIRVSFQYKNLFRVNLWAVTAVYF